jgi:hypothetical protein
MTSFKEKLKEILLTLVNECEECAMRGERIMCQTASKEETRLKCVSKVVSQILALIKEKIDAVNEIRRPKCKNAEK